MHGTRNAQSWAANSKSLAVALLIFAGITAYAGTGRRALRASRAAALSAQEGYSVQPGAGGTIQGKLLYIGKPVKPQRLAVTQDQAACGNMKIMYPVNVEQGGVAGAVVWIDNITHGKAFAFPKPVLDQKKCMFVPDVVLMKPGQLEVENSDPATHNIHIYAHFNRTSNQMMAPGSSPVELTLMRPETVMVRCDVHSWMEGYIVIAKNPYYTISGSGGAFTLTDVPPGTYQLKVWQNKLGTKEQSVTVQAGKTATVTFRLGS